MGDKITIGLKEKIEIMRSKLNNVIMEEIDKVEIIRISQELDILITKYMIKLSDQKGR